MGVAEERAGEQLSFAKDLEAVADAYDSIVLPSSAMRRMPSMTGENRAIAPGRRWSPWANPPGNDRGAGMTVEDGEVVVGEVALGVPYVFGLNVKDVGEDVMAIGIAPGAGEDDDGGL